MVDLQLKGITIKNTNETEFSESRKF